MCRVRASGTLARDCSPRGPAWQAFYDRPSPRHGAVGGAGRSRGPCSGHPNEAAALKRRIAADRERRRPVAPCAAALQRVEVMPEAFFKVRPARSFVTSSRARHPGCIAFWRGSALRPFHNKSGSSLSAPPLVGGCQSTRRNETVQWPIRCSSMRRIRRKPGWSSCAATASRNSISKPLTASSSAAISI